MIRSWQPRAPRKPSAKRFCFSRSTRTAGKPSKRFAGPTCGSEHVTYLAKQRRYKCYAKHPKAQFSLKVGTIFEDSAIGLEKWLPALWLLTNCKNGISSYELGR